MHAKIFPAKILFYKKFFDLSQIFKKYKKHFDKISEILIGI